MFDFLADWTVTLMDTLGAVGVGLAILVETAVPPLPSEVILPMAGFASTQGELNAWTAVAGATGGSLVGAWLLYWLGAAVGARRLRALADKIWLIEAADVDQALNWFSRYGEISILIGRLIPGVRGLISIPAGVRRMGLIKFTVLTMIGSGIWNGVLIWLGVLLGDNWTAVSDTLDRFSSLVYVLIALTVIATVAYLVVRDRRRKAQRSNS